MFLMSKPKPWHHKNLWLTMKKTIPYLSGLSPVTGQKLHSRFDGRWLSWDGRILLLREVENSLGLSKMHSSSRWGVYISAPSQLAPCHWVWHGQPQWPVCSVSGQERAGVGRSVGGGGWRWQVAHRVGRAGGCGVDRAGGCGVDRAGGWESGRAGGRGKSRAVVCRLMPGAVRLTKNSASVRRP